MSVAPSISLYNNAAMTTIYTSEPKLIQYLLFSDASVFYTWTDWVNDATNSPDANQLKNAADYSNYVLKLKCTMSAQYDTCGITSKEHGGVYIMAGASGSIAAVSDTSAAESNTLRLTKDEAAFLVTVT